MPSPCGAPTSNTFTPFDFTDIVAQNVTMHMEPLSGQYYSNFSGNINSDTLVTLTAKAAMPAPTPHAIYHIPGPSPYYNYSGVSPYNSGWPGVIHTAESAGLTPRRLGTGEGEQFRPRLRQGPGRIPASGGCFVEVTSHLHDGQSWTDRAAHIDAPARGLGIMLNDFLPDDERQGLLEFAPRLDRVSALAPLELKAAAWLRAAARAIQIWAKNERLGAVVINELAQAMREFTARPSSALRAPLQMTAAHSFNPRVRELLILLDTAMGHYMQAGFAETQNTAQLVLTNIVGPGVHNGLLQLGASTSVLVLEAMLQEWEAVFELPVIGLDSVPADSWARMHRAVFGLAA